MDKARLEYFCRAMEHVDATLRAIADLAEDGSPSKYAVQALAQRGHQMWGIALSLAQDGAYTPDHALKAFEELEGITVAVAT